MPTLPPATECIDAATRLQKLGGGVFEIAKNIILRVPVESPFNRHFLRQEAGETEAVLEGYGSFRDDQRPEGRTMAFFCDAFPPPILCLAQSSWVPTISYNVDLFRNPVPSPDPLVLRFRTSICMNSLLETDGTIWDSHGNLCARSRQLARILLPRL
jgi:hypothetical protein